MNKKAVIVLSLCGLFLFFKYVAQLFPSLIGTELMQTYGYDGVMLAVMASSYYYSYTFMQIFAGLLIDRYSIRMPMFIAIFLISLMIVMFTHTNNFYLMCASRALMGVGASFATVLYMKCAACYTTPKTFGVISSLLATATMLGAACGGTPVGLLFQKVGWHLGLNIVALVGFVMAFAVLIFQKAKDAGNSDVSFKLGNLKEVVAKRENWLLLLYSGLTFSPVAILGGLWGTPFLMEKFTVSAANASFFLSTMFIGHAIGSPCWALLSARLNRDTELMHIANIVSLGSILCIIYGDFSYLTSLTLFFVFGCCVGCFMLSFNICRKINALYIMGLTVAFINSGEGLISSIVEPLIGYLLDTSKVGDTFSLVDYQKALFILPCCFILSSLTLMFIKRKEVAVEFKTYARVQHA